MYSDKLSLNNATDLKILGSFINTLDYLEQKGFSTIDREALFDALIERSNIVLRDTRAIDSISDWLIYESISGSIYNEVELSNLLRTSISKLIKYLCSRINTSSNFYGCVSHSRTEGLTLYKRRIDMDLRKQIEREFLEYVLESSNGKTIMVPFGDQYSLLESLDAEVEGMLDFEKLLRNILKLIKIRNKLKHNLVRLTHKVNLAECFYSEDYAPELVSVNHETLVRLVVSVQRLLESTGLYQGNNLVYDLKTIPYREVCVFTEITDLRLE